MKKYILLFVVGMVLIGSIVLFFVSRPPHPDVTPLVEKELTFVDYSGNEVRFSGLRDRPLIVYAWASWCLYCAEELNNLGRIKEIYGDEVTAIAINRAEPRATAVAFSDELELPDGVVLLLDPEDSFYKSIEGYAMPEMVAIGVRNETLFHQRGPLSFEKMIEKIKEITAP